MASCRACKRAHSDVGIPNLAAAAAVLFSIAFTAHPEGAPPIEAQLHEDIPEEVTSPTEQFAMQAHGDVAHEFDRDLARYKQEAMRSWFFAGEYDSPLWSYDNVTPEDRYPERYDDFEDWVEDNVVDGLLEAIENHPNTKDLFETLVSFVSVGMTSERRDGADFEYSQLRENAADLDRDTRRTTSLITMNGPGEWLFGPNHQTLFRVKWLDYRGGIDDVVRWEARVQNIELFGNERFTIDQIKSEFTYESAKVKFLKAHPFGLPFLAQAGVEADPDDVKWALGFTMEKGDHGRMTDAFLNGKRQRRTAVPLQWKLDFGVKGDDDETYVGFVFAGTF